VINTNFNSISAILWLKDMKESHRFKWTNLTIIATKFIAPFYHQCSEGNTKQKSVPSMTNITENSNYGYSLQIFSSPDPKGQVSYSHHLASVVVVRRKLFQKSSPLKVLDQWKPNLVWIITRVSSFKIVSY
jgi:hypothetical protein